MSPNTRPVCNELDDLCLRVFELMEEQIKNKHEIQKSMKQGFIDIAKARYIMGNRSLSQLQLPGESSPEFTALSTVSKSEEDESCTKFVLNTVSKTKPADVSTTKEDTTRLRKNKSDSDSKTEGNQVDEKPVKIVDPIKWFGFLVPQSLRRAQTGFSLAVELATQSANIQLELESTQKRYKELHSSSSCCKETFDEKSKNT